MSSSERLEREVEQCRAQISGSLDELRARMTPGQVIDQLVGYARDASGGMFFRNLQRQVVDNPIPAAMIGVGLAWLAVATRRNGAATTADMTDKAEEMTDQAHASAQEWAERSQAAASAAGDQARETAAKVSDAAGRAAGSLQDAAASAYQTGAERANRAASAVRGSAASLRGSAANASQTVGGFFKGQPLVLAGIGLAMGAALGAALPETEAENRVAGEASDDLKQSASDFAGEQYEKAKTVAEHAYEKGKQEAEKQGLGSEADSKHRSAESESGPTLVPSSEENTVHQSEFGSAETLGGNS
jgi:hypothetical protein